MAHGETLRLRKIRLTFRILTKGDMKKRGMIPGDEISALRRKEDIPLRRERRKKEGAR